MYYNFYVAHHNSSRSVKLDQRRVTLLVGDQDVSLALDVHHRPVAVAAAVVVVGVGAFLHHDLGLACC